MEVTSVVMVRSEALGFLAYKYRMKLHLLMVDDAIPAGSKLY